MIIYSEEKIKEIFSSEKFKEEYTKYEEKKECNDFINFINNIELNTKYFRLTTNNRIGRNKRFKNKNCSSDTICLKEINSLLNKLTDRNTDSITESIKNKLVGKDYLEDLIIKNILEKCIVHQNYVSYYIQILTTIYDISESSITKITDSIYDNFNSKDIDQSQSDYLQFCDKNKKLDLCIGYSVLITELEKNNIINNRIDPAIRELISLLDDTESDDKYKCSQCLYNIFKSLYGKKNLSKEYSELINNLIEKEKSMKIKFKYMDIIDRK